MRFWEGWCNGRQSLRLDGRRVCSIKRVGISQAESNKIKACVLPSIHLPLTREASVVVRGEGLLSFCNGCEGSNIRCNGRQSLRLDGRKVCSIKRVDILQAESNKIKACALPSIHLPLTRDGHGCPKLNAQSFARMRNQQSVHMARVMVLFEG